MKKLSALLLAAAYAAQPALSVAADAPRSADEGVVTENLEKSAPVVRGQILEIFKRKHKRKMESVPFASEGDQKVFETENKIDALNRVLKNVEKARRQAKAQGKPLEERRAGLESLLKTINEQMAQNEVDLKAANANLRAANKSIASAAERIRGLEKKVSDSRAALSRHLGSIYLMSDGLYGDDNQVDLVRGIVMSRGSVADAWSDMNFKGILQARGKEYVEQFRATAEAVAADRARLDAEKAKKAAEISRLRQLERQLQVQRSYKEKILGIVARQEASNARSVALGESRSSALKVRIANMMDEYVDALQELQEKYKCEASGEGSGSNSCSGVSQYFAAETALREEAGPAVPFAWPVDPGNGITAYFRDPSYFRATGSQHEAVDILVPQGTEVKAAADGYLLYAEEPAEGRYAYAVVKHADGWVTVYGHLSEIWAKQFQPLKAGQAFAKSGGEVGKPGSGPATTGAHLHFETYQKQEPVDPLRNLDVSRIPLALLDSKYVYKYAEDYRKSHGPRSSASDIAGAEGKKFFFVDGANEQERQKNLLRNHAIPAFKDPSIWTKASADANLDPSFVMCIGMAETGLGNNVKTPYNVGNVGNDDSGDTVAFKDAKAGVQAIANTLNNKYLSKYSTVDKLSRWGNDDSHIYASSSTNWHENVTRCLSALKGRYVEDDYAFRTAKK